MLYPNILFLVIDSLRADKFFGKNKTSQTPNIDSLITKGVYFEQAISSADATILSEVSIFTGRHPFKTGIRSERFNRLNKNTFTLFNFLKSHDYHFYGYLPTISKTIGLFPNFENSDSAYNKEPRFSGNVGNKTIEKFESKELNEPWLFYIRPLDLHFPISVPKQFDHERFGPTNYEKQVSAIDMWIGKILQKIDFKKTLLIITADHGSYIKSAKINEKQISFEENGNKEILKNKIGNKVPKFLNPLKDYVFFSLEDSKKRKKSEMLEKLQLKPNEKRNLIEGRYEIDHTIFDEKIRIPLLFAGFNINHNKIISQQVRNIDIFPTICDLIGTSLDQPIDGQSLYPLIKGESIEELPAYIESNPLIRLKSNDVIGIRTSKYKYFRDKNESNKRIHLYNLESDPLENENLNHKKEIVNKMERILQDILKDTSENMSEDDEQTKEIEEELKRLGYI